MIVRNRHPACGGKRDRVLSRFSSLDPTRSSHVRARPDLLLQSWRLSGTRYVQRRQRCNLATQRLSCDPTDVASRCLLIRLRHGGRTFSPSPGLKQHARASFRARPRLTICGPPSIRFSYVAISADIFPFLSPTFHSTQFGLIDGRAVFESQMRKRVSSPADHSSMFLCGRLCEGDTMPRELSSVRCGRVSPRPFLASCAAAVFCWWAGFHPFLQSSSKSAFTSCRIRLAIGSLWPMVCLSC